MLRLILARHGETDWNIHHRYQGQQDTLLNELGLRQAQALVRGLANESIDILYTSDLRRAADTAVPIAAAHGLTPWFEPRMREMCFGVFEGLTYAEMRTRYPDILKAWEADRDNPPPGGEPISEFITRVGEFFEEIKSTHDGQTVLVTAHGGPLRQIICTALGLPPEMAWNLAMENASISEIHAYENFNLLHRLNDTHHLSGMNGAYICPPALVVAAEVVS